MPFTVLEKYLIFVWRHTLDIWSVIWTLEIQFQLMKGAACVRWKSFL